MMSKPACLARSAAARCQRRTVANIFLVHAPGLHRGITRAAHAHRAWRPAAARVKTGYWREGRCRSVRCRPARRARGLPRPSTPAPGCRRRSTAGPRCMGARSLLWWISTSSVQTTPQPPFGLDAAHRRQRPRHPVAQSVAVRHLIKTVGSRHRSNLDRFEQNVVRGGHVSFPVDWDGDTIPALCPASMGYFPEFILTPRSDPAPACLRFQVVRNAIPHHLNIALLFVTFFQFPGHLCRCDAFGCHQHQEVIGQVGDLLDEAVILL